MHEFRSKCHWILFLRVWLTIFQHWFRQWPGTDQARNHYTKQWWVDYRHMYVSFGPQLVDKTQKWVRKHIYFASPRLIHKLTFSKFWEHVHIFQFQRTTVIHGFLMITTGAIIALLLRIYIFPPTTSANDYRDISFAKPRNLHKLQNSQHNNPCNVPVSQTKPHQSSRFQISYIIFGIIPRK